MNFYCTSSKEADRPNQNLWENRHGRVMYSTEMERKEGTGTVTFNSQRYNIMWGQDLVYVRMVGSASTAYFKAGKGLFSINVMPHFNVTDDATRRRTEVHEFPFTFTDVPSLIQSNPAKYKLKRPDL